MVRGENATLWPSPFRLDYESSRASTAAEELVLAHQWGFLMILEQAQHCGVTVCPSV